MCSAEDRPRCRNCRGTTRPGFRHDKERRGLCREMPNTPALAGNWANPALPHFEPPPIHCDLCWAEFPTAEELAQHKGVEDDRLYEVGL